MCYVVGSGGKIKLEQRLDIGEASGAGCTGNDVKESGA